MCPCWKIDLIRLRRPFIRRGSPWAKRMAPTDERATEPDRHQKTPPSQLGFVVRIPEGLTPNEVCTGFTHRFFGRAFFLQMSPWNLAELRHDFELGSVPKPLFS